MIKATLLALSVAATASLFAVQTATPALAQYCEGTVHGLSGRYNPATGAGFLAVRTRPTARAYQVGELFNGDTVEIFQRRGNWYKIATTDSPMIEGWVNARWLRNDCGY
jgi:uncharacterized protein YgiM (DUF1202 family)